MDRRTALKIAGTSALIAAFPLPVMAAETRVPFEIRSRARVYPSYWLKSSGARVPWPRSEIEPIPRIWGELVQSIQHTVNLHGFEIADRVQIELRDRKGNPWLLDDDPLSLETTHGLDPQRSDLLFRACDTRIICYMKRASLTFKHRRELTHRRDFEVREVDLISTLSTCGA